MPLNSGLAPQMRSLHSVVTSKRCFLKSFRGQAVLPRFRFCRPRSFSDTHIPYLVYVHILHVRVSHPPLSSTHSPFISGCGRLSPGLMHSGFTPHTTTARVSDAREMQSRTECILFHVAHTFCSSCILSFSTWPCSCLAPYE